MRFFIFYLSCLSFLLMIPGSAKADAKPDDPCTISGAYTLTGGPELAGNGHLLVCNGTKWVRVFSFDTSGVITPQFANTPSCHNNDVVTFDSVTGGLRCGVTDIIAPIWVTPAGVIATADVNHMVGVTVAASDESGTPSYQKTAGAAWINVAVNGAVSGKAPATGGNYIVTIRATDGAGNMADRTFEIIVNPPGGPAGCANHGDVCADGTVYAGKSPDGNVDFFVMPQNLPNREPFNAGGEDWVNTALADCTNSESTCRTGQYNTNALMLLDSENAPGFQIHRAAAACYCLGEQHANAPDGIVPPECAGDPVGTNMLDGRGYDDWYLPSVAEMDVIYTNLVAPSDPDNPTWQDGVGGGATPPPAQDGPQAATFSSYERFSTSSEYNNRTNWAVGMGTGFHANGSGQKAELTPVRCARKD